MSNEQRWSVIFAKRVQQLRKDRGWSQAELGRRLGEHKLGQARIAVIESTGSVNLDQAQAFAAAFGVPVDVLLAEPPAARGAVVRQVQRLLQIQAAVYRCESEVGHLIGEIQAELPGKLPPGVAVTADRVSDLPSLRESE